MNHYSLSQERTQIKISQGKCMEQSQRDIKHRAFIIFPPWRQESITLMASMCDKYAWRGANWGS